jgi:hypothetical protein
MRVKRKERKMIHFCFYVPKTHVDKVKQAVFQAGAGRIGNYDFCSFEIEGLGQFRPLKGSSPYLGNEGNLEKVVEIKVEMVCEKALIHNVVAAMKMAHPYEVPAYFCMEILTD